MKWEVQICRGLKKWEQTCLTESQAPFVWPSDYSNGRLLQSPLVL